MGLILIDTNSPTWKQIEKFIEQERTDAIAYLIRDMDSEQQRGALKMLERLASLAHHDDKPVVLDDYT